MRSSGRTSARSPGSSRGPARSARSGCPSQVTCRSSSWRDEVHEEQAGHRPPQVASVERVQTFEQAEAAGCQGHGLQFRPRAAPLPGTARSRHVNAVAPPPATESLGSEGRSPPAVPKRLRQTMHFRGVASRSTIFRNQQIAFQESAGGPTAHWVSSKYGRMIGRASVPACDLGTTHLRWRRLVCPGALQSSVALSWERALDNRPLDSEQKPAAGGDASGLANAGPAVGWSVWPALSCGQLERNLTRAWRRPPLRSSPPPAGAAFPPTAR